CNENCECERLRGEEHEGEQQFDDVQRTSSFVHCQQLLGVVHHREGKHKLLADASGWLYRSIWSIQFEAQIDARFGILEAALSAATSTIAVRFMLSSHQYCFSYCFRVFYYP